MQIAEQICQNGVTTSELFNDELTKLVMDNGLRKIIETGTYLGRGTTSAILRGLMASPHTFDFYSIEVNPEYYQSAKKHLGNITGLHLLNGLSVPNTLTPTDITFNVPDHVIVDHYPVNRNDMYRREVAFNVSDKQLDVALKAVNYQPDLVVLDSAGHMGWIEFCYLMERVTQPFILALDDTSHVKHYETLQYIKSRSDQFVVLWSVDHDKNNASTKFGSAIIQCN